MVVMSKMLDELAFPMESMGRAMRQVAHQTSVMLRPLARLNYTGGDRHIDRVCKEILAGVPGRPAHIRLEAAAGLAEVLDRCAST